MKKFFFLTFWLSLFLGLNLVAQPTNISRNNLKGDIHLIQGIEEYKLKVKFDARTNPQLNAKGELLLDTKLYADRASSPVLKNFNSIGLKYKLLFPLANTRNMARQSEPINYNGFDIRKLAGLMEVIIPGKNKYELLELANYLETLPFVEYADIVPTKMQPPPFINNTTNSRIATPDLTSYQRYFYGDPGINVAYAHSLGITGQGMKVADIEYDWDELHEDFPASFADTACTVYPYWKDHGTSVIGLLAAKKNSFGIVGTAPDATYQGYGVYSGYEYAILKAALWLSAGDVMVIEMQTGTSHGGNGPFDCQKSVWDAVQESTRKGIHVVAAAGNGIQDLDIEDEYMAWGDNGSIIVGAGSPDTKHQKLDFSTYGSRVNVQGWGDKVFTLGYGNFAKYDNDEHRSYTDYFSGTSSATPIVASAVILIQSWAKQHLNRILTPVEMRQLLIETGTPQSGNGLFYHIGPIPNIKEAIEKITTAPTIQINIFKTETDCDETGKAQNTIYFSVIGRTTAIPTCNIGTILPYGSNWKLVHTGSAFNTPTNYTIAVGDVSKNTTITSIAQCGTPVITIKEILNDCFFPNIPRSSIYFDVTGSTATPTCNKGGISRDNDEGSWMLVNANVGLNTTTNYVITVGNTSKSVDVTSLAQCPPDGVIIDITQIITDCSPAGKARNTLYFKVSKSTETPTSNIGTISADGSNWKLVHEGAAFNTSTNYVINVGVISTKAEVTSVAQCGNTPSINVTQTVPDCNDAGQARNTIYFNVTGSTATPTCNTGTISAVGSGWKLVHEGVAYNTLINYNIVVETASKTVGVTSVAQCTQPITINVTQTVPDCNDAGQARNTIYFNVTGSTATPTCNIGIISSVGTGWKLVHEGVAYNTLTNYNIVVETASKTVGVTSVAQCTQPITINVTQTVPDCNDAGQARNTIYFNVTGSTATPTCNIGTISANGTGWKLVHEGVAYNTLTNYNIVVETASKTVGVTSVAQCTNPNITITISQFKTDCNAASKARNTIYFRVTGSTAKPTANKGTISADGANWKLVHAGIAFGSTTIYKITVGEVSKTQSVKAVSTCPKTTGDEIMNIPFDFTFYPNPSTGNINVELFGATTANLTICNVTGMALIKKDISAGINQININGLPAGIYFLIINNQYQVIRKNLIINK